ncbi:MAG: hypothetical protein Q9213_001562 [Squamulea squamosa]
MPPQSRGRATTFSQIQSAPELPLLGSFSITPASTPEAGTPRALTGPNHPPHASSSEAEDEDDDSAADEADFHSHYSLDVPSGSDTSESDSDSHEVHDIVIDQQRPFLRHSNSSFLSTNAFAPPFYNKPPTPLPPSPSLTSLLRPSFSATTSRPTTPDSSENDTPNDTEAAVAKSARTATTVPRASPKVPTYEYYGFVLYLMSSLAFEYLTLPMNSIENIVDEAANIATVDRQKNARFGSLGATEIDDLSWASIWDEGTDAVMDIPVGGVCQVLYGQD